MIQLRKSGERGHANHGWLDTFHTFSFADYYDPRHMGVGNLRVVNEDRIAPGTGFGTHGHRDMEIVTWVLDGALAHHDSAGNEGIITRDIAQRMSAGSGIRHSEMNASETESVHLLQMWVPPDTVGLPPGYEQVDVGDRIKYDELFPLASGREADAGIAIHQRDATLWIARLNASASVTIPDSPFVDVIVARGTATLGDDELQTGDAVRGDDAGALMFTAGSDGAELVVWSTYSEVTGR